MLRDEIKMIAGMDTEDIDYIGYILLKDSSYFKYMEKEVEPEKPKTVIDAVDDLKSWFESI